MTRMTPEDKVAAWYRAYTAIREELTPPGWRKALAESGPAALLQPGYVPPGDLTRLIAANDRTAAIVAAMLVSQGIRPLLLEPEPESYDGGQV